MSLLCILVIFLVFQDICKNDMFAVEGLKPQAKLLDSETAD